MSYFNMIVFQSKIVVQNWFWSTMEWVFTTYQQHGVSSEANSLSFGQYVHCLQDPDRVVMQSQI